MKNDNNVRIAVTGACGRMGKAIIEALLTTDDYPQCSLVAAFESDNHPQIGKAIENTEILLTTYQHLSKSKADVLIDFSTPEVSVHYASQCSQLGVGMVIGTTGFNDLQISTLKESAKKIPLLWAQNMSIGINAMYAVVKKAALQLQAGKLGGGYDIEIFEAHHRYKKDAPSGTAIKLGQHLAQATQSDLAKDGVFQRSRYNTSPRTNADIGFSVARAGDIIGEHRVIFAGAGEQLEVIHRSHSRTTYAHGALRAALFINQAPIGYYDSMETVLNL